VYPRLSEILARSALRDTRIVAISGPRRSGKPRLRGALRSKAAFTLAAYHFQLRGQDGLTQKKRPTPKSPKFPKSAA
jgi:hypothetical protein